MFVRLMVRLVGSAAEVLFEVLPEHVGRRHVCKVSSGSKTPVDPDREFRRLRDETRQRDAPRAKVILASQCARKTSRRVPISLFPVVQELLIGLELFNAGLDQFDALIGHDGAPHGPVELVDE